MPSRAVVTRRGDRGARRDDVVSRQAVAVVCFALGVTCADAVRAQSAALSLVWCDPTDVASGAESLARAEAQALLGRMGAQVAWRRGRAGEERRGDEIWVVLLGAGPRSGSSLHVLGATPRRRPVHPFVWVRVPHVRAAAGIVETRSPLDLPSAERRRLGVALGRVIAHEIVHALAPALPHGSGLMSDVLHRRELTAATIALDADAVLAFRAALRGEPVLVPLPHAAFFALETAARRDR